ncbi:hypothetical protein [Collimonas silvisoli]|uniref:hypothetical protein n=1 Tax=Collimonas silvisoli TaxID=2825884 RepID=UPI001B8B3C3A|nr:hypothetical protein [Collimonas silvisoli]
MLLASPLLCSDQVFSRTGSERKESQELLIKYATYNKLLQKVAEVYHGELIAIQFLP